MFGEFYIFLLIAVIPFFKWQQREEGRNVVTMAITGLFVILWLTTGTLPIVLDRTTIIVFCFALWMVASMSWSNSRQSGQDLYFMLCCLFIFLISRRIPFNILLPIILAPGLVFAFLTVYNCKHPILSAKDLPITYPIFGNANHIGAFLVIPLFAGAWLNLNMSLWFIPAVVLIAVAIAVTPCRGAQIGAITGLLFVACIQHPLFLLAVPIVILIAYYLLKSRFKSCAHRISIFIGALLLIKKMPISGHGLRTFRREYPNTVPTLRKSEFINKLFPGGFDAEVQTSHRIHNDHLEIIFELGIVGYVLFLAIFSSLSWGDNLLLSGAIIAFAVHGLFFFPLREAHTAFPFWALAGSMAATSGSIIAISPMITGVLIIVVGRLTYGVIVKLLGLAYYDYASKINVAPNAEDREGKTKLATKQNFLNRAIQCDPYNNIYLTEGYYYNVFNNPETAFQFASRCMENYDGGKVKWGVCDQYARGLLRLGGFGAVRMALKYTLHICPGFKQSIDLMKQIDQLEAQGRMKNG